MQKKLKKYKKSKLEKPKLVVMNARMEPSLRRAILSSAKLLGLNPGPMIRRCAVEDITSSPTLKPEDSEWIKKESDETRSANFTFVTLPRLAEAIKVRAESLKLTLTDYIRALAIHQILGAERMANYSDHTILDEKSDRYHPALRKGYKPKGGRWDPDPKDKKAMMEQLRKDEMVFGYTTHKKKKIVDFVQKAAEQEGLSLSAYKKKLIYQDLEKKFGEQFLTQMLNDPQEVWDLKDDYVKRMLENPNRDRELLEAGRKRWFEEKVRKADELEEKAAESATKSEE